jgi:hypothetical protein
MEEYEEAARLEELADVDEEVPQTAGMAIEDRAVAIELEMEPELAADLADPAPFVPGVEARERVWSGLERDLRHLALTLDSSLELP